MKKQIFFLCLLTLSVCGVTQQKSAPSTTVIHAGHLLDVKTGRTLDNVWVVIEGEKIVRAGTGAEAAANIIELPNATLLPTPLSAPEYF